MGSEEYLWGDWTDSTGDVNRIRYKKTWGDHVFTDEEKKKLLAGEEISFLHKGRKTTGHLQYRFYNDKEYFGFMPDFDKNYEVNPVYRQNSRCSSFRLDLEKEDVMAEYMRLNYYTKKVNDFYRITDAEGQKEGKDVTFTMNGQQYIVDEKAQMDYIYNHRPLPTFSLELLNGASGAIGWLLNSELKTEYYMFIWPHADKNVPLRVESIEYAYYALVNKRRLLIEIEKRYKKNSEQLLEYAKRMITEKMGEEDKDELGRLKGYRYKEDGFDDQGYLYYTVKKQEHPVNLVVRRSWLEGLSETYGKITR